MENLIEIKGVTHAYKTPNGLLPVLDDLNVTVPEGEFAAVVGPSGCGKSTLTRLVAGLMKPDEGEVWLHGELVKSPRKTVGMAFQNPVLLEWRTILDNVILPLEIVAPSMPRADRIARAEELLELVGLAGFEDKRPSELSGGMRQRASLCRSIVHKPDVLIMDEPFGALDAFTREDLWQTMHKLRAQEPFTAVLITHDLRESVYLGDQVIVLSGRPATTQYVLDVHYPMEDGERKLDGLYSPECAEMLATLRDQIKIAQGRVPAAAGAA
ncbi:ABC transporter ATP-binding protein [Actibacterium pelagium]|uniref:Nitrate/sulfonate/bicarbonate ABC transporter ATP-binding protein n=1 Tax=Actibacterium pelagium TaxID=2029103 RepID=A0A917EK73_9RHOB|nr:ABC transporter ATP-binding protein [Actibacterium pelagium]GGE56026.1 nitrate/sulfonate/bicarbonate ABC transporter ATP-binding protein [Actibacterium pelagium]